MKISRIDIWPVRVDYSHDEVSALVERGGVSDVIVKLTTDDGLVGWGECTRAADVPGIEAAVRAMAPLVMGRDPWHRDAILADIRIAGGWQFQAMTGNFAYAGIDMALWDICAQAAGRPLVDLLGGPLRALVDYFYYLHWDTPEGIAAQATAGRAAGYGVYYLKVGVDEALEEAMLLALRDAAGPDARIRIDTNQAWSVPDAIRLLTRWNDMVGIDFAEAPVPIHPEHLMAEVKARQPVPLCVNEGMWTVQDAERVIRSRCGDYLCFSPYWVGSIAEFMWLSRLAAHHGWMICKHTHGELGLTAAMGQHLMLAVPNATIGHQQTAQVMADDVLTAPVPIASCPSWGIPAGPGLGVQVDEDKVAALNADYRAHGEHRVYGSRFGDTTSGGEA